MSGILLDSKEEDETFVAENATEVRRGRRWIRYVALALVLLGLAVTTGSAYAAYRTERGRSNLILPGVVVQGVAVGGMTRSQAMQAVSAAVQPLLQRTITIRAGSYSWSTPVAVLGLQADIASAVDAAIAYSKEHSTVSRLVGGWRGRTYAFNVGVRYSLADGAIGRYLRAVAQAVARAPRDAQLGVQGPNLVKTRARPGAALQTADSEALLSQTVLRGSSSPVPAGIETVRLPLRSIPAKVADGTIGRTIAVNLSLNRLYLYEGLRVIRTFTVATAKPGFLTPPGEWTIVEKRMFPTWYNPAPDTWGAGEPLVVPPGPGNPMGTRALYLDAPGLIRIHGTNEPSSIGHYASHGCIRLHIPDIEALFDLVPVGTKVLIYGAPPWGIPGNYGISGA